MWGLGTTCGDAMHVSENLWVFGFFLVLNVVVGMRKVLNKAMKKDCYLLPLISNLLDAPHQA